jgi:hypothetical protein
VVAKNGVRLEIVYHSHLIVKTRFLDDLLCQTKTFRAFQDSGIEALAYTFVSIKPPFCWFGVVLEAIGGFWNTISLLPNRATRPPAKHPFSFSI